MFLKTQNESAWKTLVLYTHSLHEKNKQCLRSLTWTSVNFIHWLSYRMPETHRCCISEPSCSTADSSAAAASEVATSTLLAKSCGVGDPGGRSTHKSAGMFSTSSRAALVNAISCWIAATATSFPAANLDDANNRSGASSAAIVGWIPSRSRSTSTLKQACRRSTASLLLSVRCFGCMYRRSASVNAGANSAYRWCSSSATYTSTCSGMSIHDTLICSEFRFTTKCINARIQVKQQCQTTCWTVESFLSLYIG